MEATPEPSLKQEWGGMEMKRATGKRSNRNTRSQVDWTLEELLTLVNEVAGIESDFMQSLSSYQKWKIISDNITSLGVARSLNQCRRQWDLLLNGYNLINDWEARSGVSYWSLDREMLVELGLPLSFDRELFIFIDDNVKAQGDRSDADTDGDPDFKVLLKSGSKRKRHCQRPQESKDQEQELSLKIQNEEREMAVKMKIEEQEMPVKLKNEQEMCWKIKNEEQQMPLKMKIEEQEMSVKSNEEEHELAVKLREQADLILAILKGDGECNSFNGFKSPGEFPVEFRRWQGCELIKVLGSLVGSIDRLSDLVKGG